MYMYKILDTFFIKTHNYISLVLLYSNVVLSIFIMLIKPIKSIILSTIAFETYTYIFWLSLEAALILKPNTLECGTFRLSLLTF